MKNATKIQNKLGKTLWALALTWSQPGARPYYKTDAYLQLDRIKKRKRGKSRAADKRLAELVVDTAEAISDARRARRSGTGYWGREGIIEIIPPDPIPVRHARWVKQLVDDSAGYLDTYSGVTTTRIDIGTPGASTTTSDGGRYSRSCKFCKTDAVHHITVASDWYSAVYKRGLATVDGMLTLSAEPVDCDGYTVYKATWMRAKGKRITSQNGYIAFCDGESAHSKSAAGAKSILTRRSHERAYAKHSHAIRKKLETRQLNGEGEILVRISDSVRSGNCRSGTEEFRDRHFPGRDTATIREVLEVDTLRAFALNACMYAIRRERNER